MYEADGGGGGAVHTRARQRPPAGAGVRPGCGARLRAGGPVRRFGAFVAAEHGGVYDPASDGQSRTAGARGGERDPAGGTGPRADGRGAPAGNRNEPAAPRTAEATARLQRCVTTPGSPLGAAMGQLADAADALAAVALDDEHVDVTGDALVALHHLRSRLDATLLGLLDSFDRRQGWAADGAGNACMWLRARTTTDYAHTAALAHAARRLRHLPRLGAHLAAGDVTLAHVTAVTKAAVPQRAEAVADAQDILADLALTNPPGDVRRALRRLADATDADGSTPQPDPDHGDVLRELTLRPGYGGRGELLATLDPLTREALAVLLDAFDTPDPTDTPAGQRRSHAQRRHDAFAAMLHTLLAQPDLPTVQGARPQILLAIDLAAVFALPPDHPAADLTLADLAAILGIDLTALGLTPEPADPADGTSDPDATADEAATSAGDDATDDDENVTAADSDATAGATEDSGGAADEAPPPAGDTAPSADDTPADADDQTDTSAGAEDTTAGNDDPAPPRPTPTPAQQRHRPRPARFGSGVPIDAAAVRGLLQAATVLAVLTLGPWRAVNVGAKHRTLPSWLRGVLAAMHLRCRGPDCDRPVSWTHAHHITEWIAARTTDLNDTLPLCHYHHDLITTKGWKATLDHTTGVVTWTSPHGRTIHAPPHQS